MGKSKKVKKSHCDLDQRVMHEGRLFKKKGGKYLSDGSYAR